MYLPPLAVRIQITSSRRVKNNMVCPEGVQGTGGLGTRGLGQGESGEGEREGWGGGQEFPGVECICLSLLLSLCLCGHPGDLVFSGGTVSFWSQDKSLAASLSALSLFTSLCSLPLLASYFQLPPAFKVALDGCTCGGGGCPGCWRTAP